MLRTEVQLVSTEEVLVHAETKEKPTDSVLTILSEFTKASTEATEVNSFTPEIEV